MLGVSPSQVQDMIFMFDFKVVFIHVSNIPHITFLYQSYFRGK